MLASSAAHARRGGWRSILMTSDRDAFALIDSSTTVLRVRNGGFNEAVLVTPASLAEIYGVTPSQYRDYAALRGDPSDNLRGVPGFGSATSARLLAAFGSVDAAWAAWDAGDEQAVRDVVGDKAGEHFGSSAAREAVDRNRRLMTMRDDLPMPDLDRVRLPLESGDDEDARWPVAASGSGRRCGRSRAARRGSTPTTRRQCRSSGPGNVRCGPAENRCRGNSRFSDTLAASDLARRCRNLAARRYAAGVLTPPAPIDVTVLVPGIDAYARTATRLHPRRATVTADVSHVGGPIRWPADDPWPICTTDCPGRDEVAVPQLYGGFLAVRKPPGKGRANAAASRPEPDAGAGAVARAGRT